MSGGASAAPPDIVLFAVISSIGAVPPAGGSGIAGRPSPRRYAGAGRSAKMPAVVTAVGSAHRL